MYYSREPNHLLDYDERVYIPTVDDFGYVISVVGDDLYDIELETSGQILTLDLDEIDIV